MKFKIFLLNNSHDRETTGFNSATDYIQAIVNACEDSLSATNSTIAPESRTNTLSTATESTTNSTMTIESETSPQKTELWTQYVTHLVYLRGCQIHVDPSELKKKGIECVGVWPGREGIVYEANVLERVLTGIYSGRGGGLQRRATVQNWPIR